MSSNDEIDAMGIAAEVERSIREKKDAEFAAEYEGAVMLDVL